MPIISPSEPTIRSQPKVAPASTDTFSTSAGSSCRSPASAKRSHDGIDTTQTLIVNFNAFVPSSLDIMVYTFTKTTVWVTFHEIKQDVLLRIGRIVESHGAEIAFPTQTVYLAQPEEPPEAMRPAAAPPAAR